MAKITISETFARKVVKYLRDGAMKYHSGSEDYRRRMEMADVLEGRLDKLEQRLREKGRRP